MLADRHVGHAAADLAGRCWPTAATLATPPMLAGRCWPTAATLATRPPMLAARADGGRPMLADRGHVGSRGHAARWPQRASLWVHRELNARAHGTFVSLAGHIELVSD